MFKRVGLFLLTNIAVMLTLSITWGIVSRFLGVQAHPGSMWGLAIFSLFWGMGGAFISLQMSRWMAKRSMGVQLIDERTSHGEAAWLYSTVQRLTQQANIPMPEVGIYDSPEINAFATGPSKSRALVAVSAGLLRSMDRKEVEGVLAHEIAHVANGDMVTMTLVQGVINAFVIFFSRLAAFAVRQAISSRDDDGDGGGMSWMAGFAVQIVAEILLTLLGSIVVMWFSRQREFRADAGGAQYAGRDRMIAALERLLQTKDRAHAHADGLAAFKISGKQGLMALFMTHPPLEERIAALKR